jgi:hypothetical protein
MHEESTKNIKQVGLFRGLIRRTSFHLTKSSELTADFNDSCESIDVSSLEDDKDNEESTVVTPASPRRPLRQLCRAASSRLFASMHSKSTQTTALVDSETSLTYGDNDDESSVCSFEDDQKRVTFQRHPAVVDEIENCHFMTPQQREDIWYNRYDMLKMKGQVRMQQASLLKQGRGEFTDSIVESFVRSQMLADGGFEVEDILEYNHTGQRKSLSDMMSRLCRETVNGDACRGLEKGLLRSLRASEARVARSFILEADYSDNQEECATEYAIFSRYAAIYAEALAQADHVAALEC